MLKQKAEDLRVKLDAEPKSDMEEVVKCYAGGSAGGGEAILDDVNSSVKEAQDYLATTVKREIDATTRVCDEAKCVSAIKAASIKIGEVAKMLNQNAVKELAALLGRTKKHIKQKSRTDKTVAAQADVPESSAPMPAIFAVSKALQAEVNVGVSVFDAKGGYRVARFPPKAGKDPVGELRGNALIKRGIKSARDSMKNHGMDWSHYAFQKTDPKLKKIT